MSSHLDSAPEIAALNTAWASWIVFMKAHQPWAERGIPVWQQLRLFSADHAPGNIEKVFARLSQGKHLVQAALQWTTPTTGSHPPHKVGLADRARGEQRRFVMAYAGLERIVKTLMRLEKTSGCTDEVLRRFASCAGLSN